MEHVHLQLDIYYQTTFTKLGHHCHIKITLLMNEPITTDNTLCLVYLLLFLWPAGPSL